MSKGGSTTTTQQTTLDPGTQRYVDQYRQMAMNAAKEAQRGAGALTAGPGWASGQAGRFYSDAGAGYADLARRNLGFASPGGGDVSQYFNPYESAVIGGVQGDFDRQRTLASNRAADMATQQRAFGGSRSAILEAESLGDINRNEAQQLANLRYGGYTNAQDQLFRNQQLAGNLGLAGLGGQLQAGQGLMGLDAYRQQIETMQNMDPILRQQYALQFGGAGLQTPYGQTTTSTEQQSGNFLNSLLGAGMTVGGFLLGGPPGAMAGSALGGGGGGGGGWPTMGSGFPGWGAP